MDNPLIQRWRDATIDPAMADQAELELRRLIAENEADTDRVKSTIAQHKAPVTQGHLDHLVAVLAGEIALENKLQQRISAKREHTLQFENERLRNVVTCLEARVKILETKRNHGGGGQKTQIGDG